MLLGALLHPGGTPIDADHARAMVLGILLCVPVYFAAQLLLSVMRTGVMIVLAITMIVCMVLTVAATGGIHASSRGDAQVHLLPWFVTGWGLYLLLLYLRFSRGSLDPR